jgi:uncharacterized protein YjbJ (UPF0337 family)
MTGTGDKIKGLANEAIGKAKQGVGRVTGDGKLQAEGKGQELKGDVQKAVGDAKTAAKHAIDSAAKKANKAL